VLHLSPPTRALNAPTCHHHHGQKVNLSHAIFWHRVGIRPRHYAANSHPCSSIPRHRRYSSIVQAQCGQASVIPEHCAAHSCPPLALSPSKGHGGTLERCTGGDRVRNPCGIVARNSRSMSSPSPPALCGHPRCCRAIPGVVAFCDDETSPRRRLCT
jgi:hypothetical protein